MTGAIGAKWAGVKATLGDPTESMRAVAGGYAQTFARGVIAYTGSTGAHDLYGAAYQKWAAQPESTTWSWLGFPTADGSGDVIFQKGAIIANPDAGAEHLIGGINYRTWIGAGKTATLGYPTSDEVAGRGGGVSRMNWFTHGAITYGTYGSRAVVGAIYNTWMRAGSELSTYASPVSNQVKNGGIEDQPFSGGSSVLSYANGRVTVVSGAIGAEYRALGMSRGSVGYPTAAMTHVAGGYRQQFSKGYISNIGGRTVAIPANGPAAPGTTIHPATSQQVMVADHTSGHKGTWARYQWTGTTWQRLDARGTDSVFGSGGIVTASQRRRNTNTTPAGTFGFVSVFGIGGYTGKIPYTKVNGCSWWNENPADASHYNRYQYTCSPRSAGLSDPSTGEYLPNYTGSMYRQAGVLDYNYYAPQHRSGGGSGAGIFLHYATTYTGGCVALNSHTELNQTLAWLDPSQDPKIVIKS